MKIYKPVTASESYPENYTEMGYDGLDDAISQLDAIDECIENMQKLSTEIRDYLGENSVEWFSGSDEAYEFRDKCNPVIDKLSDAYMALNRFFTYL